MEILEHTHFKAGSYEEILKLPLGITPIMPEAFVQSSI